MQTQMFNPESPLEIILSILHITDGVTEAQKGRDLLGVPQMALEVIGQPLLNKRLSLGL